MICADSSGWPSTTAYPYSLTQEDNAKLAHPFQKFSDYNKVTYHPGGGLTLIMGDPAQIPQSAIEAATRAAMRIEERLAMEEVSKQ